MQKMGGGGASSFRFDDWFRGTKDIYGGNVTSASVAIRGAMAKVEPTEGTEP